MTRPTNDQKNIDSPFGIGALCLGRAHCAYDAGRQSSLAVHLF